jgi:hypothetical protein
MKTDPTVRLKPDTTYGEPDTTNEKLKPDAALWADWRKRFTERAEWRLTEHFFRAMFDFGFLSDLASDSFKRVLIGSVGGFVAFGLLLTRMYMAKYAVLWSSGTPERYRNALLGDDLMMIGLPMLLVAFVTLLVSHSLFPDERDFRILGPLPVSRLVVFRAKLGAVTLFTGLFIVAAHVSLLPLVLLTSLNPWGEQNPILRLAGWAIASLIGSAFAVLTITAVVGALVFALSRGQLQALSTFMRSMVLGLLVVCLPLVSHLPALGAALSNRASYMALVPPAWFLGLQRVLQGGADPWLLRLSLIGVAAALAVGAIVAATYIVLFRQFERLMFRPAQTSPPWWRGDRLPARANATPPFKGAYQFVIATIGRSQLHQGVLIGLSACGLGLAAILLSSFSLNTSALFVPFVLMFACGVGARAALALPIEYRANWIFQVTEDQTTRREQLRAVDRVVTIYVIGVPLAAAVPLLWMTLGRDALLPMAVVASVGLVFVHLVLLDWRRIPFTCSYLPGKRFIGHSALIGVAGCLLFTVAAGGFVRIAIVRQTEGAVIVAALLVVAFWLRERRLVAWRKTPLMFEDEFPDQPLQLQL